MSKTFRPWDVDQIWLLPPSVQDLVPFGHVAHFVRDTVRAGLDLSRIMASYDEERGFPPYHPGMMVALLLYAYSQGVYSSRRIARGCEERLDFAAVTGMQRPDFRTISEFRKRHLAELAALFRQVLELCRAAGLVKLGHVALDGTKIKANAGINKAMSYGRMKEAEPRLAAEVQGWLTQAAAIDKAEDRQFGAAKRGEEMPDWVADKQKRLEKIREAKAALEAEARAKAERTKTERAEAAAKAKQDRDGAGGLSAGRQAKAGRKPKPQPGEPDSKAQRNFTDPDSRVMPTRSGFIQGYNAQAAVDGAHQIIVAQILTNTPSDQDALAPLLNAIRANLGRNPKEASADAGYCSQANIRTLIRRRIAGYIATGRQKHGTRSATARRQSKRGTLVARMSTKLKRAGHRSRYRLRKQIVEPVFGQIKQARGFRQFLLRSIEKVRSEWAMICTAHNPNKLAAAR
jgi:transposase